jgi:hypothetical protein
VSNDKKIKPHRRRPEVSLGGRIQKQNMKETLRSAQLAGSGDPRPAQTMVGGKWLSVVVKYAQTDAFVVTAYLTDKPKAGEDLWPTK